MAYTASELYSFRFKVLKDVEIFVNVHKDGNFKSCKYSGINGFGKKVIHEVPPQNYPLVLRVRGTHIDRKVYRNGVLIAYVFKLD